MSVLVAFVNDVTGSRLSGCQVLWAQSAVILKEKGLAHVGMAFRSGAHPDMLEVECLIKRGCESFYEKPPSFGIVTRAFRRLLKIRDDQDPRVSTLGWLDSINPSLVVVCQSGCIGVDFWGPRLQKKGIPYVTLTQSADLRMWPSDEINNHLREGYQGSMCNFFVSDGNRWTVETMLGVPLDNAAIVCNPFRVPRDLQYSWPIEESPLRMACVARLHPQSKGQDILLQSLAGEKWKNRDFHLSLIGSGPCQNALRLLVETLGLTDKVSFLGQVRDINAVWEQHHCLVMPSRYEGMSLAVLEALVRGRPCLVTDIAGNAEYITEGENGFLAEAPTVKHFSAALERAWAQRSRFWQMGHNAYERARKQLPPDPADDFSKKLISLCS
jgi:glycosyltransferase involved in cell wall biosynthesis